MKTVRPFVFFLSAVFLFLPGVLFAQTGGASNPGGPPALHGVKISKIEVTGNKALKEKDLAPVIRKLEGKVLTFSGLEKAASKIKELYQKRGYVLAIAYIPPQKVEGGVVRINVVEGKIEKVIVRGNPRWYSKPFIKRQFAPVLAAPAFNQKDLERALLDLNQLPDMHATATLSPGKLQGTSDIIVRADCAIPFDFALSYNNYGTSAAGGRTRLGAALDVANLLKQGSLLSLSGVTGERPGDFAFGRAGYSLQLDSMGTRLGGYYMDGDFNVGGALAALGISGKTTGYGMYVSYPFIKSRLLSLTGQAGWDWTHSREFILGGTPFSRDKTLAIKAGLSFEKVDTEGKTDGDLYIFQGLGHWLGAMAANDPMASRADADNRFTKFDFDASRLQRIAAPVFLLLRGSGQISTRPLVVSQQFSLGGEGSVRGYEQGESLGDSGYAVSAEGRLAPFKNRDIFQLALFLDNGTAYRLHPEAGESRATSLTGWGTGVRFAFPFGLQASGDVGFPIHPSKTVDGKSTMYYLQALWKFKDGGLF